MREIANFDKISINLASNDRIREWSYGEVKKPETINYRTLRPERDGLFCERIFGTTKEWECYCGKFKSQRYKGVICDRCGVEVTHFKIRRERMGHIELASPVSHIWYYKSVPSRIGLLLNISVNELRSVLYYEKYIVIDPGDTDLKEKELLSEEEYIENRDKYGESFQADIGAGGIKTLLENTDLEAEAFNLREKMNEKGEKTDARLLKRLEIIDDFRNSTNQPEWMIMDVIPVIPPELRPMCQLDGGRFATSDLNDLYRRVINRNNRLKRLMQLKAPEIIIRNEKRMLQEAVDALFDNSRRKRVVKGPGNRPLKSLSDMLKGKQGRFRQNLLGKRVDYSGRSVIVVGPELRLHQCGLPKKMALELFKPFIMRGLHAKGIVSNIKSAKKLVEKEENDVWGVLEEVVKEHPVLLNRAPTLHRLGIQAFEPVLVEGKAIKLHPLVCHAFNADFDGDQMAVHVPLSPEAQMECWLLMLSSKNLLNPANGAPIVSPSQDMVLGISYLTKERRKAHGEGKFFSSFEEIIYAIENKAVSYQARIKLLKKDGFLETTPGRLIFNEALPEAMEYINEPLNDKGLNKVIFSCFKKYGPYQTSLVLDKIKDLGFKFATIFGATIGIEDIKIPEKKKELITAAENKVGKIEEQYRNGYITDDERYNKVVNEWSYIKDRISDVMMDALKIDRMGFNPLYIMAESGARGSKQQIQQLAGMRGLMATPSGKIMELPIKSNFKEGLSVLEYFISTHGARKGLADTALKTADAGYLTRRLVDIAQDVIITKEDCGTINGIDMKAIREGDEEIEPLSERIVGRFILEDIYHPKTGELICEMDVEVDEDTAAKIEKAGIEKVKIRSVLTCESKHGVCVKCYGRNLATNRTVEVGEAVGTIAAQSIGQPGTQLTMRTFHIGGTAAKQIEEESIEISYNGLITEMPENLIQTEDNRTICSRKGTVLVKRIIEELIIDKIDKLQIKSDDKLLIGDEIGTDKETGETVFSKHNCTTLIRDGILYLIGIENRVNLKSGSVVKVKEGDIVNKGTVIAEFDPYNEPIMAEISGKIEFIDIITGMTLKEETSEETGRVERIVTEVRDGSLLPKIKVIGKNNEETEINIPGGAILLVENGQEIKSGDLIAKITREQSKTKDITGGLPRVAELFEARKPKDTCVVAEQDGIVRFGERQKGKSIINIETQIVDEEGEFQVELVKHVIPAGKRILVREGEYVNAGDQLSDGPINPHDILKIEGDQKLQEYLVAEIQEVYRLQGVNINDKHVGIIIRQMLKKVEITDVGDTDFIIGQQVDKFEFREKNEEVINQGGKPATAKPVLLGITKASLNMDSFFSAASFQETTKVLTNAAIKGKIDYLRGLKENIIIGHLIPAGTGIKYYEHVDIEIPEDEKKNEIETYDEDVFEIETEEIELNSTDDDDDIDEVVAEETKAE